MAKQLHIHVYVPGTHAWVHDAKSEHEELVDRFLELLAKHSTQTQDDAEVGHPFYGNQYTDVVLGPKPTTSTAKGAKNKVLELFSSGHGFTLKELADAAGTAGTNPLYNIFADLKKSKGLHIAKNKEGLYNIVKANGEPAAPPEPVKVEPKAEAPANPPPAPAAPPAAQAKAPGLEHVPEITVPPVKMSKELADKHYAQQMYDANEQAIALMFNKEANPKEAALFWKTAKAQAMAQWATNHSGSLHKPPAKVEVFQEDINLMNSFNELDGGLEEEKDNVAALLAKWKEDTHKAKFAPKPAPLAAPKLPAKATPASHKPGPVTSLDPHTNKPPKAPPALKAPEVIAPSDWDGPSKEDFTDGKFKKEITKLKSTLSKGHTDKVSNKKGVQAALEHRLQASPHFQHWQHQFHKASGGESLAATLISHWAASSGGNNPTSCAMQHAIMEAFNMNPQHIEFSQLKALDVDSPSNTYRTAAKSNGLGNLSTDAELHSFRTALKDFALAQYHNTQDHFKEMGIKEVFVARGMGVSSPLGSKPVKGRLKLQPASSFSADLSTANHKFSYGQSVYFAKVPASQVLSSYVTGYGCTHEHELVVLADPGMTAVHTAAHKVSNLEAAMYHIDTGVDKWH